MDAIVEQGRSVMKLLVILALIVAWACFERRPDVLETAMIPIDVALYQAHNIEGAAHPFRELSDSAHKDFGQYYYQYGFAEKAAVLSQVTFASFAEFARYIESHSEDVLGTNEEAFDKIRSWHHKSGLGEDATLGDVEAAVAPHFQVPGTSQSVDLERCLVFIAMLLIALQAYLCSLLITMKSMVPAGLTDRARSWIVFHDHRLGRCLAVLWVMAPTAAWVLRQVVMPLGDVRDWPSTGMLILAGVLAVACALTLRVIGAVRREALAKATPREPPLQVPRRAA